MVKQRRRLYMISVVAEMFDVHPQTLRAYEREGLLRPNRTDGNTRLYSDDDLERIELILRLTKELGVNLAGVEVILNMRERMHEMQQRMTDAIREMARQVEDQVKEYEEDQHRAEGLVPVGRKGIARRIPVKPGELRDAPPRERSREGEAT